MKKEYESYTVFEFDGEYESFNVGDKINTKVTVSPRLYNGNITYTSSDESIATIDQNGVITRLKDGDATIKVTLNRQTVDGVVYKPELYSIGGGDDYYEVEMKKLFY